MVGKKKGRGCLERDSLICNMISAHGELRGIDGARQDCLF